MNGTVNILLTIIPVKWPCSLSKESQATCDVYPDLTEKDENAQEKVLNTLEGSECKRKIIRRITFYQRARQELNPRWPG
mgnify:CR=1 FL=1